MTTADRRGWLKVGLGAIGAAALWRPGHLRAGGPDLALPADVPTTVYDFEQPRLEGWAVVAGQWAVEDLPDAPKGKKGLVQRATGNAFNVIVAPDVFADTDVSVGF